MTLCHLGQNSNFEYEILISHQFHCKWSHVTYFCKIPKKWISPRFKGEYLLSYIVNSAVFMKSMINIFFLLHT